MVSTLESLNLGQPDNHGMNLLYNLCSINIDTDTDTTWIRTCRIYILYNYELYKLTIKIYVYKYVSDFFF